MAIKFHCTSCEADFEIEIPRLIDRPTALKCSGCDARPPAHRAQALGTALEDLLSAMAAIRGQVRFEIKLETDALPPPYGPIEEGEGGLGGLDDDDLVEGVDDEEEEEEEGEEDEDSDYDEDDEDEDDEDEDEDSEDDEAGFDYDSDDDDDDDGDDDDDDDEEEDDED